LLLPSTFMGFSLLVTIAAGLPGVPVCLDVPVPDGQIQVKLAEFPDSRIDLLPDWQIYEKTRKREKKQAKTKYESNKQQGTNERRARREQLAKIRGLSALAGSRKGKKAWVYGFSPL
jgi:hypothetical protein